MTVAELKSLDAGAWFDPKFAGERIPTLAELLAWGKDRVPIAIEIKNGPLYYPGIAAKTVQLLRAYGMERQAILISFDHLVLREVKMIAPDVATGILYACWSGSAGRCGCTAPRLGLRYAGSCRERPCRRSGCQPVVPERRAIFALVRQYGSG
jgi:glycerophosphoryl diester phosphodiesterase